MRSISLVSRQSQNPQQRHQRQGNDQRTEGRAALFAISDTAAIIMPDKQDLDDEVGHGTIISPGKYACAMPSGKMPQIGVRSSRHTLRIWAEAQLSLAAGQRRTDYLAARLAGE